MLDALKFCLIRKVAGMLTVATLVVGGASIAKAQVVPGTGEKMTEIGVPGVPVIATPPAATVCAAEVCFANSSIIAIGFSTEGKGDTNNPVAIKVGVAAGTVDKGCTQAEIKVALTIRVTAASDTRFLLLMDSPLLDSTNDGSTSPLKRQAVC